MFRHGTEAQVLAEGPRELLRRREAAARELARLMRTPQVDESEQAVDSGRRWGFSIATSRPVESARFAGLVVVEYTNDDPDRNPGYEIGTQSAVHVLGVLHGHGGEHAVSTTWRSNYVGRSGVTEPEVEALELAATAVQQEMQTSHPQQS